jgi:hypothetical protein
MNPMGATMLSLVIMIIMCWLNTTVVGHYLIQRIWEWTTWAYTHGPNLGFEQQMILYVKTLKHNMMLFAAAKVGAFVFEHLNKPIEDIMASRMEKMQTTLSGMESHLYGMESHLQQKIDSFAISLNTQEKLALESILSHHQVQNELKLLTSHSNYQSFISKTLQLVTTTNSLVDLPKLMNQFMIHYMGHWPALEN